MQFERAGTRRCRNQETDRHRGGPLIRPRWLLRPPLRAIVAEAGVSVQSVHLAGPKSSLVLAAWEHAFAGDEGAHSLLQRPAMAQMLAELDSAVALSHFVAFIVEANARGAGFWRAMRTAADADPQEGAAVSA